jgi:ACS family hexuronate transporter-like MFS transporter
MAQDITSVWGAVAIIGLATAGHQAFSANLYTFPSDVFARSAVGSVVGIGGTIGAIGGMSMALFTGYVLQTTHSYSLLFGICAAAYFFALLAVHLLSPTLATVSVKGVPA